MNKEKQISLRKYVRRNYISLIIVFGVLILDIVALVLVQALTGNLIAEIILSILAGLLIVAMFVLFIYFAEKNYKFFYDKVLMSNMKNLESLKNHTMEVSDVDDESVEELKEMNEAFDDINKLYKGKVITSKEDDVNNIPMEYLDDEHVIVTYDSLANNLTDLVIIAKSFRNALVEISYGADVKLDDDDFYKLVEKIKKALEYQGLLISKNKNEDGVLVYVPIFDSTSQLKEELAGLFRHISIVKRTSEGKKVVSAKICMVIYPYSDSEHMISDLAIAKRSDKPINVYLPNKQNAGNNTLLYENMNLNMINKVSERLDLLDSDIGNGQKEISYALSDLCNYFSFTVVGYTKFNKVKKQHLCEYSYSPSNRHLVLKDKPLSIKFVNKLMLERDIDQSYYFSSRKHLNDSLGAFIDSHDIKSGLFYLVMKDNEPVCVIYFLNDDKDMEFDSMIKQGLINISNKIGNYLKRLDSEHISTINSRRFEEILKLNNDILYSVDPDTYSLFFLSAALKSICPKAKVEDKCYKALYGLDAPCKGCPLKTKKHMVEILKRRKYETSVVLHNSIDKAEHLLLKPMESKKGTSDLFSQEFLVNSYYALCQTLEDEFNLGQNGEILFLNIDNVPKLIKTFGNDGYIQLIRTFFDRLNYDLELKANTYLYRNDVFALLLPTSEKDDIVKLVESIYPLSKDIHVGGKKASIEISYYDFKYPDENTEYKTWINHVERVMTGLRRGKSSDILYFGDDKYVRSASRETFMLNNVLEAFKKKKYFMEYQPIVGNRDRTIHGVELLLRLIDPFTGGNINIGEAINVVTKNNRIDLVADAVMDCLDKLFSVSDLPFFKSMGLEHMAINIEYTTLSDPSFVAAFNNLRNKHNIPKDFMSFEIQERDIRDHYQEYCNLHIPDVVFVCDQYQGEMLRLDQLKNAGFTEVKISRDVILNIVQDDFALDRAINAWRQASAEGMMVTFVGVERRQQADLLYDDVLDSCFQGRFFYSPMKEDKFFKVLRENSIKEIADLDN